MREIKFRAWDKKTKKMREVNSIAFHNGREAFDFDPSNLPKVVNLWGKDVIEQKPIILHREINQVELMQYTGLKDKNGKEIYEGDILHDYDDQILWEVKWDEDRACFHLVGIGVMEWLMFDEFQDWRDKTDDLMLDYYGNIYEHPHLLHPQDAIEPTEQPNEVGDDQ